MNKRYIGNLYEDIAADYLKDNGFEILERNYKCKIGEIDIIALKDNIIRFIEIKYRKNSDYGYPIQAISKKKQIKIMKTAQWFIAERKISEDFGCSFDVISIQGSGGPNNIQYYFNCYGAM